VVDSRLELGARRRARSRLRANAIRELLRCVVHKLRIVLYVYR
jgi:hypothetical protein